MASVPNQPNTSSKQHDPADVEATIQVTEALQKEIQALKNVVEDMEETLDYRQKELERQEKKSNKAEQQSKAHKTDLEKYKTELALLKQETQKNTAQWKKKLAERQQSEQAALKQLEDARNHIFRLQPRRTDITETEASQLFNDLFNSVSRWVANRMEKILDMQEDGHLRGRIYPKDAARKVLQLTSARAKQSNNWTGSDEFQIIAVLMRFLCSSFFDRVFYCPMVLEDQQNDTTTTISRMEQLMKALPRGNIALPYLIQSLIPGRKVAVSSLARGSFTGAHPGTRFCAATRSLRGHKNGRALQSSCASGSKRGTARARRIHKKEHHQTRHGVSSPVAIVCNHLYPEMDIL